MRFARTAMRWIRNAATKRSRHGTFDRMPYRPRAALLSRGELAFYTCLRSVVGSHFGIGIKPRLADVVWCPPRLFHTGVGGRVSQKHLDFVLYDLRTTAVALAIELDDRSHARRERRSRDRFVDEVLSRCGVGLLRVEAAHAYDANALREHIEQLLWSTKMQSRDVGTRKQLARR